MYLQILHVNAWDPGPDLWSLCDVLWLDGCSIHHTHGQGRFQQLVHDVLPKNVIQQFTHLIEFSGLKCTCWEGHILYLFTHSMTQYISTWRELTMMKVTLEKAKSRNVKCGKKYPVIWPPFSDPKSQGQLSMQYFFSIITAHRTHLGMDRIKNRCCIHSRCIGDELGTTGMNLGEFGQVVGLQSERQQGCNCYQLHDTNDTKGLDQGILWDSWRLILKEKIWRKYYEWLSLLRLRETTPSPCIGLQKMMKNVLIVSVPPFQYRTPLFEVDACEMPELLHWKSPFSRSSLRGFAGRLDKPQSHDPDFCPQRCGDPAFP